MKNNKMNIFVIIILTIAFFVTAFPINSVYAEEPSPGATATPEPPADPPLSNNANLSMIYVDGNAVPGFSPDNLCYNYTLNSHVETCKLSATAQDANATVGGTGVKSLPVGPSNFLITVTAQDGVTQKLYSINLNNNASLVPIIDPTPSPTPQVETSPFSLTIADTRNWSHTMYQYRGSVIIANSAGISVKAENISSDYSVNATVNGGTVPSDMTFQKNYSGGTLLIHCKYYGDASPKKFNVGSDISCSVTFPSLDISITVTDNTTGTSKTVSQSIPAKKVPSAYDAYQNNRNDELFMFEDRFLEYMQDKRIDKNAEDIAANKEQIEKNSKDIADNKEQLSENQTAVNNLQEKVGQLGCHVNELESEVETMRRLLFTFKNEFDTDSNLESIVFSYRELPEQMAFRLSDLIFTTAYAAEDEWTHIKLNRDNYEIELEFDKERSYDVYWVAHYSDNTTIKEYYRLDPQANEPLIMSNSSEIERPVQTTQPSNGMDENSNNSMASQTPELSSTLIIICIIFFIMGGGIGIFGYLIGSKRIKLINRKTLKSINETSNNVDD